MFLRDAFKKALALVSTAAALSFSAAAQGAMPRTFGDDPKVGPLRAEFSRTALGRELLEYADSCNVDIVHNDMLMCSAEYSPMENRIRVDSRLKMEDQVVFFAHEIRHAWQDKTLGDWHAEDSVLLSPQQVWTLRRYCEADAAAFSAYFWADRMTALAGETFSASENSESEFIAASYLRCEVDSPDGLTLDEYKDMVLVPFLNGLSWYDRRHLECASKPKRTLTAVLNKAADKGPAALEGIAQRLDLAPDAASFENFLRGYGGLSLDPAAPTSLRGAAVTGVLLMQDYPLPSADVLKLEEEFQVLKKEVREKAVIPSLR